MEVETFVARSSGGVTLARPDPGNAGEGGSSRDGVPIRRHSIPPPRSKGWSTRQSNAPGVPAGAKPSARIPHGQGVDKFRSGRLPRSAACWPQYGRGAREHAKHIPHPGTCKRASDTQTRWSAALFDGWQVQDSNLRRHTPTDLQNDGTHAVNCGFTATQPKFRRTSSRIRQAVAKPMRKAGLVLRNPLGVSYLQLRLPNTAGTMKRSLPSAATGGQRVEVSSPHDRPQGTPVRRLAAGRCRPSIHRRRGRRYPRRPRRRRRGPESAYRPA
jgi:hypothetical protein